MVAEGNNNVEVAVEDIHIPVVGGIHTAGEVGHRGSLTGVHRQAYSCSYWFHGSLGHNNPLLTQTPRYLDEPHTAVVQVADIVAVDHNILVVACLDPLFNRVVYQLVAVSSWLLLTQGSPCFIYHYRVDRMTQSRF